MRHFKRLMTIMLAIMTMVKSSMTVTNDMGRLNTVPRQAQLILSFFSVLLMTPTLLKPKIIIVHILTANG